MEVDFGDGSWRRTRRAGVPSSPGRNLDFRWGNREDTGGASTYLLVGHQYLLIMEGNAVRLSPFGLVKSEEISVGFRSPRM